MGQVGVLAGSDTHEMAWVMASGDQAPENVMVVLCGKETGPPWEVGVLGVIGTHRIIVGEARDPAV